MKTGDLIIDKETREVGLIIDIDHAHEEYYGSSFGRDGAFGPRTYPYRVTSLDNGYTTWLEKNYIELNCEVISKGS